MVVQYRADPDYVRARRNLARGIRRPIPFADSRNDAKHLASGDSLALFCGKALYGATLWRANFILHLHGFHNHQTLAGFDFVSYSDEDANHFPGHRSDYLLMPFRFDSAVAASAPGARISDFRGELLQGSLQLEFAVRRWRNLNCVRVTVEKNRNCAKVDLCYVGIDWLSAN